MEVSATPNGVSYAPTLYEPRLGVWPARAGLPLLLIWSLVRCSGPADDVTPDGPLRPNVRGADIHVIADSGEHDPAPVVLPAAPLHLIIDDCREFVLFDVPDSGSDPYRGIVILNWSEGDDRQRSLTIIARSPSCASHAGVKRFLEHLQDGA
jgi:hypothetical protein